MGLSNRLCQAMLCSPPIFAVFMLRFTNCLAVAVHQTDVRVALMCLSNSLQQSELAHLPKCQKTVLYEKPSIIRKFESNLQQARSQVFRLLLVHTHVAHTLRHRQLQLQFMHFIIFSLDKTKVKCCMMSNKFKRKTQVPDCVECLKKVQR